MDIELEDVNLVAVREEEAGGRVGWRQSIPKEEEKKE